MLGPIAMFGVGPLELLILGVIALVVLGGPVVAVVIIVILMRRNTSRPDADLLPCPDCGRMVSRQAASCPQCGRPLRPV